MKRWEHAITTHSADDILGEMAAPHPEGEPPILFCDGEGKCFFDSSPSPYVDAITHVLDTRGSQGWELVQVVLRTRDMICFWRREAIA